MVASRPNRTAATREALIDATVSSLVERGFARTTSTKIVQDAQVSLGAMSHHFPFRTELMTATVAHLPERRQEELRERAAAVGDDADRAGKVIDLLWTAFAGALHGELARAVPRAPAGAVRRHCPDRGGHGPRQQRDGGRRPHVDRRPPGRHHSHRDVALARTRVTASPPGVATPDRQIWPVLDEGTSMHDVLIVHATGRGQ